ncbi:hypothetical protein SAMN04488565_0903 [Leucobacter chromiiresistens]|uniref:Uncharacterized protein n=1 Tax=Leucobacter chromiiresistens TaxID=1079994 RepID=A0A1H0YI80_9MICO|nr:hypothetical protein SAMN04488565_0903 [Leucobacter chromiiresistens]
MNPNQNPFKNSTAFIIAILVLTAAIAVIGYAAIGALFS